MDPFQTFQYGDIAGNDAPYQPFEFEYNEQAAGFATQAAEDLLGLGNGNVAATPEPPILQIQAQVDAEGNWYYPNPEQQNRDLRIQCEAFRAGAASRSGVRLPLHAIRDSTPLPSPRRLGGRTSTPTIRRVSRLVKPKLKYAKKKKTSWVEICTCEKADVPKRPKNAFVIFRMRKNKALQAAVNQNASLVSRDSFGRPMSIQASVSTLAARWWNDLKTKGAAQEYFDAAEKEAEEHAAMYPGYKYLPDKKYKDQWGDENCTCGAYQLNEAKRLAREQEDAPHHDEDYEGSEQYEESYLRATGQASSKLTGLRNSFEEPPTKRRKASAGARSAQDTGYSTTFDENSIFSRDSYNYDGSIDPSANAINPQLTRNLRAHSRQSFDTAAQTESTADNMTEEEYQAFFDAMAPAGGNHRSLFIPGFVDPNDGQVQDENVGRQRTSGGSFDSLFDMEESGGVQRPWRSSRSGNK